MCCHAPGEFLRKEHGEDLWQMPPTLGSETVVMVVDVANGIDQAHFSKSI